MPEINQTVFICGRKNFNYNEALNSFHVMETLLLCENFAASEEGPFDQVRCVVLRLPRVSGSMRPDVPETLQKELSNVARFE